MVSNELGQQEPAEFLLEASVCDIAGGSERYLHQSCCNRVQATALSYDSNLLSYCKKRQCYEKRNISHLLCDDCLGQMLADPDVEAHQVQIKVQNAGMYLTVASFLCSSCVSLSCWASACLSKERAIALLAEPSYCWQSNI